MAPLEPSFPVLSPAEQTLFPDLLLTVPSRWHTAQKILSTGAMPITTAASAPTPLKIR